MPDLRRMLPSSNALFVFDAAARNGSFTAAAAELNVTQPAVSRMLGRFEEYLGVRLFDRTAGGATLTEEGELLYRRVTDGFRSIESGLIEIDRRRRGTETVTLSVSSAFTTHWLMPRIDKLQRAFPSVDLRFQLISGSLRGAVEMLTALLSGQALCVPDEETCLDADRLARWLDREGVTEFYAPDLVISAVYEAAGELGLGLGALRRVSQGGEPLQLSGLKRRFHTERPHVRLHSTYGPSETHLVAKLSLPGAVADWPADTLAGRHHAPLGEGDARLDLCRT